MDTNSALGSRVQPQNWGHTIKNMNKYCFEWTIHEYTNYIVNDVSGLGSFTFVMDTDNWTMIICNDPHREYDSSMEEYYTVKKLTVFLLSTSDNIRGINTCKISLLNFKRQEVMAETFNLAPDITNYRRADGAKVSGRVTLCDIGRRRKELLPNDCLTLRCEMNLWSNPIFKLKAINSPESLMGQDLGYLLDNPEFSNLELCVGDKVFHVHKNMLTTRSSVFRAMFEHDMKEKHENRVHITDMDSEVVHQMLRFIYTGKVDTDKLGKFGVELLGAADKYHLQDLKTLCEQFLTKNLTAWNCASMLRVAKMYRAEQLEFYASRNRDSLLNFDWIKSYMTPGLFFTLLVIALFVTIIALLVIAVKELFWIFFSFLTFYYFILFIIF